MLEFTKGLWPCISWVSLSKKLEFNLLSFQSAWISWSWLSLWSWFEVSTWRDRLWFPPVVKSSNGCWLGASRETSKGLAGGGNTLWAGSKFRSDTGEIDERASCEWSKVFLLAVPCGQSGEVFMSRFLGHLSGLLKFPDDSRGGVKERLEKSTFDLDTSSKLSFSWKLGRSILVRGNICGTVFEFFSFSLWIFQPSQEIDLVGNSRLIDFVVDKDNELVNKSPIPLASSCPFLGRVSLASDITWCSAIWSMASDIESSWEVNPIFSCLWRWLEAS